MTATRTRFTLAGIVLALATGVLLERPLAFQTMRIDSWWVRHMAVADQPIADLEPGTPHHPPIELTRAANTDHQYTFQRYDNDKPLPAIRGAFQPPAEASVVPVSNARQLLRALREARPGTVIEPAPGDYFLQQRAIALAQAGTAVAPIYLRPQRFGEVTLYLNTREGFNVSAPFWVFENLRIRGNCPRHQDCEHALHVVGKAKAFTLRNSEVTDFNAPLKVNLGRYRDGSVSYPDFGLLEYNVFRNPSPRRTNGPVTLLNINAADGWTVRHNLIADFAKLGGDRVSYGAFMKSNSHDGLFEYNVVVCENALPADEGLRIGLSFGGGGSSVSACRQGDCRREHSNGTMRGNLIAHCSRDVGIYLNRASNSTIAHNLLYNTAGIDVRFASTSAHLSHNLVAGRLSRRDGGTATSHGDRYFPHCTGAGLLPCALARNIKPAALPTLFSSANDALSIED